MALRIRPFATLAAATLAAAGVAFAAVKADAPKPDPAAAGKPVLVDASFRPLAGKTPVNLRSAYAGQVLLVVNTASKCGFTPQFEALEKLHATYRSKGFAVLGFPSGDFREQEFEDEKQIQEFCTLTYGVKFPMFQKTHVVGPETNAFYAQLAKASGESPKWNFHKYLVGRDGRLLGSWGSRTKPDDPEIVAALEKALKAPGPARR